MTFKLELHEVVHTSAMIRVERCWQPDEQRFVISKRATDAGMSAGLVARIRFEHHILTRLAAAEARNVVRPLALLEQQSGPALIVEDIGGSAIRDVLHHCPDLDTLLHIAHETIVALADTHRTGIVHNDINPNNIVYSAHALRLIDFGIASELRSEEHTHETLQDIEGTFAYMSPEQTGRVNRPIDYRTDFYSLGVTLYESIAGRAPYLESDPVDLMHAILTRPPPDLSVLAAHAPKVVCRIIAKLMSKDAGERYQGAAVLMEDVGRCRALLQASGSIADFPIGVNDVSERFSISQRLYGREREVAGLRELCDRAIGGERPMAVITGAAGTGKSALVNELQQSAVRRNAFFAAGKYDQSRRHVPLTGMTMILTALVRHIFREAPKEAERWRRRMQEAAGNVGQAVVDLVPAVQNLIGSQKPLVDLPPQETENRLLTVLLRLFRAMAEKRPLVLFLDDLQWADLGSLKLLKRLASDNIAKGGLFLIVAYRHQEMAADHEVLSALEEIRRGRDRLEMFALAPLTLADVAALIQDATGAADPDVAPLASVIFDKTAGNPFFVRALLQDLRQQDVFQYDPAAHCWSWSMSGVMQAPMASSAVDLLLNQLALLDAQTLELMGLAAVLGKEFSLTDLGVVSQQSRRTLMTRLTATMHAGLMVPLSSAYRYAADTEDDVRLRFVHERVQQAVYQRLTTGQREQAHFDTAQHLLAQVRSEGSMFAMVNHINQAAARFTDLDARLVAARSNVTAAREARCSAAPRLALEYTQQAVAFMGDTGWTQQPAVMWDIAVEALDSQILLGHYDPVSVQLNALASRAQNAREDSDIVVRRCRLLSIQGRHADAIRCGLEGLARLGVPVPKRAAKWQVVVSMWRLKTALAGRRPIDLAESPALTDVSTDLCTVVFQSFASSLFLLDPLAYFIALLELNRLFARNGVSRHSASVASGLATAYTKTGRSQAANAWWLLCDLLVKRFPDSVGYGIILFCSALIRENFPPPAALLGSLDEANRRLLEVGNPSDAAVTLRQAAQVAMCMSMDAWEKRIEALEVGAAFLETKSAEIEAFASTMRRAQRSGFDEPEWFSHQDTAHLAQPILVRRFYLVMDMLMAYVRRDIPQAVFFTQQVASESIRTSTNWTSTWVAFFGALILTQSAAAGGKRQVAQASLLRIMRRQLLGITPAGSGALANLVILVDAEVAALRGDDRAAARLYDAATAQLSECGYSLFAAVAYECAGRYYVGRQLQSPAAAYLSKAWRAYHNWGAAPKVRQLRQEFAHLLDGAYSGGIAPEIGTGKIYQLPAAKASTVKSGSTTGSGSGSVASFDQALVGQACLAISSEVTVDRVVEKILDATTKCAGATRAALFATQSGTITCIADTEGSGAATAEELLSYALQSGETIIIDEPKTDDRFHDDYFQVTQARAICCAPIVYQGETKGLAYLENSSLPGVFDVRRMVTVNLLVAQAAISLENARMVTHLDSLVSERTAEVRKANDRIVLMERQQAEAQMAGGFAHEIRNALSGACYVLAAAHPVEGVNPDAPTLSEQIAQAVERLRILAPDLGGTALAQGQLHEVLDQMTSTHTMTREIYDKLYEDLSRAQAVTERILEYSQVDQVLPGDANTPAEPLFAELLNELKSDLTASRISTVLSIAQNLAVPMQKEHLTVICRNALRNARDAVDERAGPEPRMIRIDAQLTARDIVVAVHDTGLGMTAAVQSRLFEPFFSTKGSRGMGLGLSLSRKLARIYGGDIDFTFPDDGGTIFRLRIPIIGSRASNKD